MATGTSFHNTCTVAADGDRRHVKDGAKGWCLSHEIAVYRDGIDWATDTATVWVKL